MENFFHDKRIWPGGGPFPHFLVLLNAYPAYRAYARAHHELLGQYGAKLGVVPEEWLHATVQGIHHPTTRQQIDALRAATREELRGMLPFTVQLGPTWPGVTAVTVAFYPETGMAELNTRVRAAASTVTGIELPAAETKFWAHSSLSYARWDFDDRELNHALRALRPERVEITIDRVHLVHQFQHPAVGYYTWDVVEEFRFGTAS